MGAEGLVANERLLAAVLGASGAATIVTSVDGTVQYWNDAATTLFGWTASEAAGRPVVELTTPVTARGRAEAIMTQLRQGESWRGEFWLTSKDGRTFPAMVTDTPVSDADGHLIGIVGVTVDMTAQHAQAQAASDR